MSESSINVTEGSGKRLHTWDKTISSVLVQDQVVIEGEPHLATYAVPFDTTSVATLNDHVFQLMAGSSLHVYVRRIYLAQQGFATTATTVLDVRRLSTAGTGGTAATPNPLDPSDAACGATFMNLPSSKGTEVGSSSLFRVPVTFAATSTTTVLMPPSLDLAFDIRGAKSLRIAAGTSNGIALKLLLTGGASNTVAGFVVFSEASY